jgi:GGDEF domain-containing protein
VIGKIHTGFNHSSILRNKIIEGSTCFLTTNGAGTTQVRLSLLPNGTIQRLSQDGIPLNIDLTRFGFFSLDELLDHVRLRGTWTGEVLIEIDEERSEQRLLSVHRISDFTADEVGFVLIVKSVPLIECSNSDSDESTSIDGLTGLYSTTTFENLLAPRANFSFKKKLRAFILVIATSIDTKNVIAVGEEVYRDIQSHLAQRLNKATCGCDMSTYLGSFGFAVNINNIDENWELSTMVINIRNALSYPIDMNGNMLPVSVRVGQVEMHKGDISMARLFMQAWERMI